MAGLNLSSLSELGRQNVDSNWNQLERITATPRARLCHPQLGKTRPTAVFPQQLGSGSTVETQEQGLVYAPQYFCGDEDRPDVCEANR